MFVIKIAVEIYIYIYILSSNYRKIIKNVYSGSDYAVLRRFFSVSKWLGDVFRALSIISAQSPKIAQICVQRAGVFIPKILRVSMWIKVP